MLGASISFGIPFPCELETVTPASFQAMALATEAAIASVDATATAVTHQPAFRALGSTTPAPGVEGTLIYTSGVASLSSNGVTVNTAAGTITIITPGYYVAWAQSQGNQSTLTMTSDRVSVYNNGVLYTAKKMRNGFPAGVGALTGSMEAGLGPLQIGDVITFRYLWTGTGVLSAPATVNVALAFLGSL